MIEYIEREKLPQKKERGFFLDDNFNAGWNACLNNIKDIPAADVRPVMRGKWVKHNATHVQKGGMYLECSCCHEYITVLGHVFAYCPNCGALMEDGNG